MLQLILRVQVIRDVEHVGYKRGPNVMTHEATHPYREKSTNPQTTNEPTSSALMQTQRPKIYLTHGPLKIFKGPL